MIESFNQLSAPPCADASVGSLLPVIPICPSPVRESECICSSEKQRLVRVINDLVTVDS